MNNNPKCPHCCVELSYDDTVDMEYDSESVILQSVGHCPSCGRDYQWQESAVIKDWKFDSLRLV